MNHWLVVLNEANSETELKELNFTLLGLPERYRHRAQLMEPGDRIVFYVKGLQGFAATATISGPYFTSEEPIWRHKRELFPCRLPLKPDVTLKFGLLLDAKPLVRQLTFSLIQ